MDRLRETKKSGNIAIAPTLAKVGANTINICYIDDPVDWYYNKTAATPKSMEEISKEEFLLDLPRYFVDTFEFKDLERMVDLLISYTDGEYRFIKTNTGNLFITSRKFLILIMYEADFDIEEVDKEQKLTDSGKSNVH